MIYLLSVCLSICVSTYLMGAGLKNWLALVTGSDESKFLGRGLETQVGFLVAAWRYDSSFEEKSCTVLSGLSAGG